MYGSFLHSFCKSNNTDTFRSIAYSVTISASYFYITFHLCAHSTVTINVSSSYITFHSFAQTVTINVIYL